MSTSKPGGAPFVSAFKNDPDMLPLIEEFVAELADRVGELRRNFESGQTEGVKRIAHQLKGAGSGYGFDAITKAAATLESSLKALDGDLADVQRPFDELIDLCSRARA